MDIEFNMVTKRSRSAGGTSPLVAPERFVIVDFVFEFFDFLVSIVLVGLCFGGLFVLVFVFKVFFLS